MKPVVIPLTLTEANAYVERHHRHSIPTAGHKFSVGAAVGETVVGVAIVGRPVARGSPASYGNITCSAATAISSKNAPTR